MKVLALSPHTDDIELGCGGYLSRLTEDGHSVYVVTFSHIFHGKDLQDEFKASMDVLKVAGYRIHNLQTREFDRQEVLDIMIQLRKEVTPDIVLAPSLTDIHQDHTVVAQEAVRAFSKFCSLLHYELPWNTRAFEPTHFIKLKGRHIDHKLEMLAAYESQRGRPYFDWKFIGALPRVRGQQCGTTYAEGYEVTSWID